jgi:Na+/H+-dicarboxylate symporter
VPLTGLPLVMGVDRILDMARTLVNVTGDLVLCRIVTPKGHRTNETPEPEATPVPAENSSADSPA